MPPASLAVWLTVIALEFAALLSAMRKLGRKLDKMAVDQKTFDDSLTAYVQGGNALADSVEKYLAATKDHPVTTDYSTEYGILGSGLQTFQKAKADLDAATPPILTNAPEGTPAPAGA